MDSCSPNQVGAGFAGMIMFEGQIPRLRPPVADYARDDKGGRASVG
jgi:hypothetical protein